MNKTKPWKTITIGKEPVLDKDIYISSWAKDLMSKVTYSKKKEKIDLIILTPKDLGFTVMPSTKELFDVKNLKKYGVELYPAEVGVHLRAEYDDQPNSEWLYIAHKPITDSDGYPRVFCVGRVGDGERWLRGRWAYADLQWPLGYRFVFRLRKSLDLDALNLASFSDTQFSALPAESSDESLESRITNIENFMKDNFKNFTV